MRGNFSVAHYKKYVRSGFNAVVEAGWNNALMIITKI